MFVTSNHVAAEPADARLGIYRVSDHLSRFSEAFCRRFHLGAGVNKVDVAVIAAFELRIGHSDRELWGPGRQLPAATIDKLAHRLLHRFWGSLREVYPDIRVDDIADVIRSTAVA